jgi:beta-phosphoglucomutase
LNSKAAFIFDMDGVIVDSNPFHKIALKQFCKKYGKDLTEDELREKIYGRRNQDWLLNVFGKLEPDKMNAYADEKEALFRELYQKDIKLLDGLASFLERMDDYAIPRAIATSAPRSNVDFTLEKTHIGRYFETILDSSFVDKGKPHPQIYLKTVAALDFEPRNCVVFEDSLAGVESARNAGCKVVGITTTHTAEELAGTDLVVDDFVGLDPKTLISTLFAM